MEVRVVAGGRVESRPVGELRRLHGDSSADRPESPGSVRDRIVWVDVPSCDDAARGTLADVFGFHHLALRDCVARNHIPKIHVYPDHVFVVLHAPELGDRGHVHYIELDQFIGPNYLVTVHGPVSDAVSASATAQETGTVLHRIESGHLHPASSYDLSHAIVSALVRRQEEFLALVAQECGLLEQRVMTGEVVADRQQFLEQLFRIRHELLAVRTMAAQSREVYGRLQTLTRFVPVDVQPLVADIVDQFERVRSMADGQMEFVRGVIELYQTRITLQMTIVAEDQNETAVRQNDDMRKISAWVAIIAVPTAVTGFFGQNLPYPGFGTPAGFLASCIVMIVAAVVLFVIFKRKKWL